MGLIVPLTLAIIFMLLYLSFKNVLEPLLIMLSVPFALAGGVWLLYLLGERLSVAAAVGFIALAGVAAEFGVVMLVYLNEAMTCRRPSNPEQLKEAVLEGAGNRVRPKTMTVAVIVGGLLPILYAEGVGLELMRPVAVPLVGGMLSAPLVSMFLLPLLFYLLIKRQLDRTREKTD
jgi:Cu(I)/Ag(I) efflux system membrane protein CusA/SilA